MLEGDLLPEDESGGSNMDRKEIPAEKVKPPYPVKHDLLKETLENIPLAVLNDKPKQKPKVVMKKEFKGLMVHRTDAQIRTQQITAGAENVLSTLGLNKGSV